MHVDNRAHAVSVKPRVTCEVTLPYLALGFQDDQISAAEHDAHFSFSIIQGNVVNMPFGSAILLVAHLTLLRRLSNEVSLLVCMSLMTMPTTGSFTVSTSGLFA